MAAPTFTNCPRCAEPMIDGFAARSAGLSFVRRETFEAHAPQDEELTGPSRPGMFSDPEYLDSYLCRACELYVTDFSKSLKVSDVEAIIEARTGIVINAPEPL